METPVVPVWEKVLLTIDEAAAYSNLGKNLLRDITKEPTCTFALYKGKRDVLIKRKSFEKYLEEHKAI